MTRMCRCLVVFFMLMASTWIPALRAAETSAEAAAMTTAEAAVNTYISNLLQQMGTIKPLYETDRKAYFDAVETALVEFVDFNEVARGVRARYGVGPNGATPQQLQRFSDVFRASLVDFYGSALANYGGAEFEIIPMETPPDDPQNATNVRMIIQADDGNRFEVQYTMFLNQNRVWLLKNLYIEGVNLRRQYYSQFDSMMTSHDYDIDKVIDNWQVAK